MIETIAYDHPMITHASVAAQRRWAEISGADRIHYCGAYWRWGFHEDGCWSAIRACERLLRAPADRGRAGAGRVSGRARAVASAIYEGWVRHRRLEPVEHSFRYPIFMAYLDLAELPEVLDPLRGWSARRPAPAWFRRADHLGADGRAARPGRARRGRRRDRRAPAAARSGC